MAEAGYGTIAKGAPETDHLIDFLKTNANQTIIYAAVDTHRLHKSRDFDVFCKALKEVGKALERMAGRSPQPRLGLILAPLLLPLLHATPYLAAGLSCRIFYY